MLFYSPEGSLRYDTAFANLSFGDFVKPSFLCMIGLLGTICSIFFLGFLFWCCSVICSMGWGILFVLC